MPGRKYIVDSHTSASEPWDPRPKQVKTSGITKGKAKGPGKEANLVESKPTECAITKTKVGKLVDRKQSGSNTGSAGSIQKRPGVGEVTKHVNRGSPVKKKKIFGKVEKSRPRLSENGADPLVSETKSISALAREEGSFNRQHKNTASEDEQSQEDGADLTFGDLTNAILDIATHSPGGVSEIEKDTRDILEDSEYAQDFVDYLMTREHSFELKPHFLDKSPHITSSRRSIIVDWIIEVQQHLALEMDTLHMCVALIDQFCSRRTVTLQNLQLVGITSLLIASKFVERFPPEITTLVELTEDTYCRDDVIAAEREVLAELKYDIALPVASTFLFRNVKLAKNNNEKFVSLCHFLIDLALPDIQCTLFPPSLRAAAALHLGQLIWAEMMKTEADDLWTSSLRSCTSYTTEDLKPCMKKMAKLLTKLEKSKYQGTRSKYAAIIPYHSISHEPLLIDGATVTSLVSES